MKILIKLNNHLILEALHILLKSELREHELFTDDSQPPAWVPDIIIIEFKNMDNTLFSRYPGAKVLMMDTGLGQEELMAAFCSYKIDGILPENIDIGLFKKALKVVNRGEIWINNKTVKAVLHNMRIFNKPEKISAVTAKEKEVIQYVAKGYKNKEIASRLFVSEQTIKAHLNRLYGKYKLSNRSELIAFMKNNQML